MTRDGIVHIKCSRVQQLPRESRQGVLIIPENSASKNAKFCNIARAMILYLIYVSFFFWFPTEFSRRSSVCSGCLVTQICLHEALVRGKRRTSYPHGVSPARAARGINDGAWIAPAAGSRHDISSRPPRPLPLSLSPPHPTHGIGLLRPGLAVKPGSASSSRGLGRAPCPSGRASHGAPSARAANGVLLVLPSLTGASAPGGHTVSVRQGGQGPVHGTAGPGRGRARYRRARQGRLTSPHDIGRLTGARASRARLAAIRTW